MQFISQGSNADSQKLCGLGSIVVDFLQGLKNKRFFHLPDGKPGFDVNLTGGLSVALGRIQQQVFG
jgi:hypothetical protein